MICIVSQSSLENERLDLLVTSTHKYMLHVMKTVKKLKETNKQTKQKQNTVNQKLNHINNDKLKEM